MWINALKTTAVAAFAFVVLPSTVQAPKVTMPIISSPAIENYSTETILAKRSLTLDNRHQNEPTNEVFKQNILLNLAYLDGSITDASQIDWELLNQPRVFDIQLAPNEVFAYHDDLLPDYENNSVKTVSTYFDQQDGYLSSGFLYGDGVCHLASIINWAAQDAQLESRVTKLHSIAPIPDVPDQYGVSIYTIRGKTGSGMRNNLYITNNTRHEIVFRFEYDGENTVTVTVIKTENLPLTLPPTERA